MNDTEIEIDSLEERCNSLYSRYFKLEQFTDSMTDEEIDAVFYVTDGGMGSYIEKVMDCKGSINWLNENTMDSVEAMIVRLEKEIIVLEKKFNPGNNLQ